jgi:hypothetical protein
MSIPDTFSRQIVLRTSTITVIPPAIAGLIMIGSGEELAAHSARIMAHPQPYFSISASGVGVLTSKAYITSGVHWTLGGYSGYDSTPVIEDYCRYCLHNQCGHLPTSRIRRERIDHNAHPLMESIYEYAEKTQAFTEMLVWVRANLGDNIVEEAAQVITTLGEVVDAVEESGVVDVATEVLDRVTIGI